jgi:RHS repeat-associated protein
VRAIPSSGIQSFCVSSSPTGALLTYDAERRLTAWQNAPTSPTSQAWFLYDGEGHRVEQYTSGGSGNHTYYLPGNVEEVTPSGSLSKYYAASGLALGENTTTSASGISYLASDGLGSVSEALTQTGTATGSVLYGPYGNVRYSSGTMPTTKGFTGQYADASTGLDYYGARYYDPSLGQFASADSVADGLNRYGYVKGNPETATDPTGHRQCMDDTACSIVTTSVSTVISAAGVNSALWARYLRNTAQDTPNTITIKTTKPVHFDDHKLPGGKPHYVDYTTTTEVDNSPAIWKALRDSDRLGKLGMAVTAVGAVLDVVVAGHNYADAHPHAAGWKPVVYGVYHSLISTGITLGIGAVLAPAGAEGIAAAAVITTVASPMIDDAADKGATGVVNAIQDTGDFMVTSASQYGAYATANIPLHVQVNFGPISFMTGTQSSWP